MSQSGYTPIQLYYSTTASNTPSTSNLKLGELAFNIADNKIYALNTASNAIQTVVGTLGNQNKTAVSITGGAIDGTTVGATTASTGAFTTLSASSTVSGSGFSTYLASPPAIGSTTANTGAFTTLTASTPIGISSGGTNSSATPTSGGIGYGTGTAHAFTAAGTSNQVLISNGSSAPSWSSLSSIGVSSFSAGSTGLTPSSATTGAISLSGTLNVANGGTGLTTLTSGRIPYGNGTSALNTSSNLSFDGTNLSVGGFINLSGPIFEYSGTTTISAGGTNTIITLPAGIYLASSISSNGDGNVYAVAIVVSRYGTSLTQIYSLTSSFISYGNGGSAQLQITNGGGSSFTIAWKILQFV